MAFSTALIFSSLQPMRILTVTGFSTAATIFETTS